MELNLSNIFDYQNMSFVELLKHKNEYPENIINVDNQINHLYFWNKLDFIKIYAEEIFGDEILMNSFNKEVMRVINLFKENEEPKIEVKENNNIREQLLLYSYYNFLLN